MSSHADSNPWTVPALAQAKRAGRKLVMLTAYDASFARTFDVNGVDLILVGDSLGMVMQGHDSTLAVTTADMVYHTAAVARALDRALLVADLSFQADATPERALDAATQLLQAGAEMVKIEGAGHKLEVIRYLVEREIPVCSHLGLTPQSVLRFGGYKVQGRGEAASSCAAMRRRWSTPVPAWWYWNACRRRSPRKSAQNSACPPSASVPAPVATARCW